MAIRRSKFLKRDGPTSRLSGDCAIEGCPRPMFRAGLCCAHYKRKQRNKTVDGLIGATKADGGLELGEVLDPSERTLIAGNAWIECSSEDDERNAYLRRTFLRTAAAWLESMGWVPPPNAARKLARMA